LMVRGEYRTGARNHTWSRDIPAARSVAAGLTRA
jgi:hypothetical protein